METASLPWRHGHSNSESGSEAADICAIKRSAVDNHGACVELESKDIVTLAVLGIVYESPAAPDDVVAAVKYLGSAEWQPTTDVISACINRALSSGYLIFAVESPQFLGLSSKGKELFRSLMRTPAPSCRNWLGRTCLAVKVCFLNLLDRLDRNWLLQDIRAHYNDTRASLESECADCPHHRMCLLRRMENEIDRIQWEVARLDRLARRLT